MDEKTLNKNTKATLIKMLIEAKTEVTAIQITRENEEATYKNEIKNTQKTIAASKVRFNKMKYNASVNQNYVNAVNEYNKLPFNKRWMTSFPTTPKH